jgi:glycosyltransferase involved in cell wall biosynthesis
MKYSIVLPCYNESGNLVPLVNRYRPFAEKWNFELILVNNGSTDDSARILENIITDSANSFARVVNIETNIGYGHGIHTGLQTAKGEILSYSHADAQTPPEDLFRAFELIESGQVDISRQVIKGSRPGRDEANLCTMGLVKITNIMTGYQFEDINGQPKVFSNRLLRAMDDPPTDFSYDTYLLYVAARLNFLVTAINVRFDPRGHGVSKSASNALRRYKTIISYLKSMAGMVWRRRKDKDNPMGQIMRFITNRNTY